MPMNQKHRALNNVNRSIENPDSYVQRMYDQALDRMGPQRRVQKSFSMHMEVSQMIAFSIRSSDPEISERELKRRVAMRMYLSDDRTQVLLEKLAT